MAQWTNPLARHGVYWDDIQKLPEVNQGINDIMRTQVVPAWVNNSPEDDGDYKDSIQVTTESTDKGRGVVSATAPHAHFVEFGSAHTPEYAPAEKTAKQFGGYAIDKSAVTD